MTEQSPEKILTSGNVDAWNAWRERNRNVMPQFAYISLKGVDLRGINLKAIKFTGNTDFRGSNFKNADLEGICIDSAKLKGANLSGVNLSNAGLNSADLTGANLSGANLMNASLDSALLIDVDFTDVNLAGANLRKARLEKANLRGSKLAGANLTDAYLINANLMGADLTTANLIDANLTNANLRGAKLIGAKLVDTKLIGAKLTGANLEGASLTGADMDKAVFGTTLVSKRATGLRNLTDEQKKGVVFASGSAGGKTLKSVPIPILPHRVISFSSVVGQGVILTAVFLSFRGYHNQVPQFEPVLEAAGLSEPEVFPQGAEKDEFRAFVGRALLRMANAAELPAAEKTVAEALEILEETMVGVSGSPLENWSLERIADLKSGAAVGAAAWATGEPTVFLSCVLGGIFVLELGTPVAAALGNRMKVMIESADLIELWQRIAEVISPPDGSA
jgi:uncharacterized protein YjbI with pentapeptide repeats